MSAFIAMEGLGSTKPSPVPAHLACSGSESCEPVITRRYDYWCSVSWAGYHSPLSSKLWLISEAQPMLIKALIKYYCTKWLIYYWWQTASICTIDSVVVPDFPAWARHRFKYKFDIYKSGCVSIQRVLCVLSLMEIESKRIYIFVAFEYFQCSVSSISLLHLFVKGMRKLNLLCSFYQYHWALLKC